MDSKFYSPLCLFIGVLGLILNFGEGESIVERDFSAHFNAYGVEGCFILFDEDEKNYIEYNSTMCNAGYIPASTFKIPHSLIVLEEGLIRDTNEVIQWDGKVWDIPQWNSDQTLKTAIQNSVVWAFVGFAKELGLEKYNEYMNAFNYGNKNLNGPPDRFWLAGGLRISAREQVDFLHRMYNYKLPVSKTSVEIVKNCIVLDKSGSYTLSGKTGAGVISDSEYIMWLVGYVEAEGKTYFYALNFVTDNFEESRNARYKISRSILKELGIIKV